MKNDAVLDAVGMINEEAVRDAKDYRRPRRRGWFMRGAVAACLCAALAIGMFAAPDSEVLTGPGLLTVTAYASSAGENIEVFEEYDMQEGITFPYEYGWDITTNVVPGLPLKFSVPEYSEAAIEISVSGGQFISWENSSPDPVADPNVLGLDDILGQNFVIPNDSTIYWRNFVFSDDGVQFFSDDMAYVDVVLYDGDAIIGYAVIAIYPVSRGNASPRYFAEILKTVSFPAENGEHQNVPRDYVDRQLEAVKENHTALPVE